MICVLGVAPLTHMSRKEIAYDQVGPITDPTPIDTPPCQEKGQKRAQRATVDPMDLGKRARIVPQRRVSGEISYLSSIGSKNQAWLFMIKSSSHLTSWHPTSASGTGKTNAIKFSGVSYLKQGNRAGVYSI